jgi:hypothetical protein
MMVSLDLLYSHADTLFARDGGLHPPSEVIIGWPRPNHVNPDERGWEAPIALLAILGITFLVYIARMWARLALAKNAGLDDILISLSMLPLFGLTISVVLGKTTSIYCDLGLRSEAIRQYGYQWHVWDQTAETLVTSRQVDLIVIF